MKKSKNLMMFLCIILIIGITGCSSTKDNEESNKFQYILDRNYPERRKLVEYAINDTYYGEEDTQYTFADINDDGYQELLIRYYSTDDKTEERTGYIIDTYKYYTGSRSVSKDNSFSLDYDSKLYFDKSTDKYYVSHSEGNNEFNTIYDEYGYMDGKYIKENGKYYIKDYNNKTEITEEEYNNELSKYILIDFTFENYISELYEYKEFLNSTSNDDKTTNTTTDTTTNNNLKCTPSDVDNIIRLLKQGKYVEVPTGTGLTYTKYEGMQYYNSEYPYYTQYTISCGSYSQTIRIGHK